MRDRGFSFTAVNQADTVTVEIQLHWDHGVPHDEPTNVLTQAYGEAFVKAVNAIEEKAV